jgi:hypothetical protein
VRVDHEEADAVVELARDGQGLVREEPPGRSAADMELWVAARTT